MPGNSWRDRLHQPAIGELEPQSSQPMLSPQLDFLLKQRQQLEDNLRKLTSGEIGRSDPRDAARFQVPTFAKRQAEQRMWEARRNQQVSEASKQSKEKMADDARERSVVNALTDPPVRSKSRSFQPSMNKWTNRRNQHRQLQRAAHSRSIGRATADAALKARQQLRDVGRQLRDVDQRLAEKGMEQERQELRSLGADKLLAVDAVLDRAEARLEAPRKAVRKLDELQERRKNAVAGAMDRFGAYAQRSRQKLDMECGGSGDLLERATRLRERVLEQRREQRQQEQRDQERRDRALQRRKEREDV